MSKIIKTTTGESIIVGSDDFVWLSQSSWGLNTTGYARRTVRRKTNPGGFGTLFMHHQLLKPPTGHEIDHISGNKLDNRRENLRIVTRSTNTQRTRRAAQSGYAGVEVARHNGRRKYTARIMIDGKRHYLGSFETPLEAAKAYDAAALLLFDCHARVNSPRRKRTTQ